MNLKKYKTKLLSHKVFANMVVHDMRNPASCIEHCLEEMAELIGVPPNDNTITDDEEDPVLVAERAKNVRFTNSSEPFTP